jgi:hypothetical protein
MMTGLLRDDEASELIRAVERRNVLLAAMCAANANSLPAAFACRLTPLLDADTG